MAVASLRNLESVLNMILENYCIKHVIGTVMHSSCGPSHGNILAGVTKSHHHVRQVYSNILKVEYPDYMLSLTLHGCRLRSTNELTTFVKKFCQDRTCMTHNKSMN
jgi:hypothetical protein